MLDDTSYKIPGYTLSEVLVVLVVTALVVGIAFTVLRLVVYQLNKIELAYTDRTEMAMFKQRLYIDIERAQSINWNHEDAILKLEDSGESITYAMEENFIVRDDDTIPFGVADYKTYVLGKEVVSGSIDALRIMISVRGQEVPVFVEKEGGAQQQIAPLWD